MRGVSKLGLSLLACGGLVGLLQSCVLRPHRVPPASCDESSCDDGNPCTDDVCQEDGTCAFAAREEGSSCDDGDLCNGISQCDASGTCMLGEPIDISDGMPCTEDLCDPQTGEVTHEPIDGCVVTTPAWEALSTTAAPSPRRDHRAIWTGTEMIIWGGSGPMGELGDGASYDPGTDTWSAIASAGAPSPRHSHSMVWTGTHMLVWGGFGSNDFLTDGAKYDPANDTWAPLSNTGAPEGRVTHGTVWTGSEMLVWGGFRGSTVLSDGARYNVTQDSWQAMPSMGAPSQRLRPTAAWVASRMLIWGGGNTFDWLADGGLFDPAADSWTATSSAGDLKFRERASGVVNGNDVIVWGGWDGGNFLNDGSLFDASAGAGSWTPIAVANAPSGRADHTAVWTDDTMFVWGGCAGQDCTDLYRADGGRYTPNDSGGVWSPVLSDPLLSERALHSAVWTGTDAILWGGFSKAGYLGDGARTSFPDNPE